MDSVFGRRGRGKRGREHLARVHLQLLCIGKYGRRQDQLSSTGSDPIARLTVAAVEPDSA
jgi:hypothetical protein